MTACADDDNDNGSDSPGEENNVVDENEEENEETVDGESMEPEFVAERASSFFEAAGEVGVSGEELEEATQLSEEEQMAWAEEQYQDIVWEYFDVEEDAELEDLENEYTLAITAATFSTDLGEATDGIINMEMSPPTFLGEHTEVDEEAGSAVSNAFLVDTVRNLDETYEDASDEEIIDELLASGGALPVHLEYVDGVWFIDAQNTMESFSSGGTAPEDTMDEDGSGIVGEGPIDDEMTEDTMDEEPTVEDDTMDENSDM